MTSEPTPPAGAGPLGEDPLRVPDTGAPTVGLDPERSRPQTGAEGTASRWWQVLVGYALVLAICGLTAAVVFQLAHVVDGPSFPTAADGKLEDDFWTHQLKTTANFAPRNALAMFLTGGLNHQVEHHLFPRICHIHYAELSTLVEATAKKHGVPYHASPTFLGALASHTRWLKAMGASEEVSLAPALS